MPPASLITDGIVEVRTTFATRAEAEACAALLVERRLAACVQIDGPVTSVYRWKAVVETATEWRCTCKTTAACRDACIAAITTAHGYETPEVLVSLAEAGETYAAWVRASVSVP